MRLSVARANADWAARDWRAAGVYLAWVSALAALYAAVAVFGLKYAVIPGAGTPIWPASGVALAALILGGVRLWPAIFIGRLAAAIMVDSPQPWWADVLLAGCNTLGVVVPALAARSLKTFDAGLAALPEMLWLFAAAVAGALIASVPGVFVLWAAGADPAALPHILFTGAVGSAAGILTVTPLILAWTRRDAWRLRPVQWTHLAICLATVTVLTAAVFVYQPLRPTPTWSVFPALIWAALAFSVRGASAALAITSTIALYCTVTGLGPFSSAVAGSEARLILTQAFIGVSAATVLALASVADERRGRQRIAAIALSNARLYEAAKVELAERHRAEARLRLLINELNHRVKNTLATVQSITAQTLGGVDDLAQAREAVTDRIIALARAHDVITDSAWAGADLREILWRELSGFDGGVGRVVLEGPAAWLEPKAAVALGLAAHELATNAVKYGALSQPTGQVRVAWRLAAHDGGAPQLRLTWTERGGPPVTRPSRRGFGSRLLERGLAADLGAGARLKFLAAGVVCEITAAIAEPAEPPYLEVGPSV